jgi:nucleoside-diphosphate-sugar epimerase
MKAFVTGGTGFIGSRLILKLLLRGYEVHALCRSQKDADALHAVGVYPAKGDILDQQSMVRGMAGSDVVFHVAGWYKFGGRDQSIARAINVDGTRNVLSLAYELGVPKIIHTSTVGVFGDTNGRLVDENYVMPPYQKFLTEYDRTKWMAHYEVAMQLIKTGAPVIITIPGAVYGRGDPSLVGTLMRLYYRGLLPIAFAPEFVLTYAHVDDIAEGHILAAEKGNIGESYILAGPAVSLRDIMNLWANILDRRPPSLEIPSQYLTPLAPLVGLVERLVPLPEIISQDTLNILGASYAARSDRARMELGWRIRPLEEGMRETLAWIAGRTPGIQLTPAERRRLAAWALSAAILILALWLRKRKQK